MSTQMEEKETKIAGAAISAEATAAPNKKLRRGVNNETRSTSLLKFDERRDANRNNGLFIGHLDNVEVKWVTIGEEVQSLPQFAGLAIPILVLEFASNHEDVDQRRHVSLRLMPAESNALTIPGGKEAWKVDSVFGWMKHVLNVFVLKGKAMTEEQEDMLTLPFEDFDEQGNYVPVEAENVVKGWRVVFENFVKILDNDGKPYYKAANGGILPIWMKLLRFTKVNKEWRAVVNGKTTYGDLGFTNFVGEGCIELYKQESAPNLKIDVTKESITYKETKKDAPKASVMPGAGVVPPMAGGIPTPVMPDSAFGNGAGESPFMTGNPADDLPF